MRKLQFMFKDGQLFARYVLPSMLSMITAGVYTLVDGLFVGWGAGSDGMAALNVAYPLALFLIAIGEMIGIGGAINISIARGRGYVRTANLAFGTMLRLLIPAVVITLIPIPFLDILLRWMGAAPELLPISKEYAVIILGGGVFQLAGISMLEAMRNDGAPTRAMTILVIGLLGNVLFDYLFVIVFKGGVAGSAWATLLAQATCFVMALHYFCSKRSELNPFAPWRLHSIFLKRLLLSGVPSFGVQLSIGVVIWCHNAQALRYGGVNGVAAYAILSYVEAVILLLIQGIALGIQPIVSYLHGAGKFLRRTRMAGYGLAVGVLFGFGGMVLSIFGRHLLPQLFNAHGEVAAIAAQGLLLAAPVYPLLGFQKVSESYFQSMERPGAASLLIYLDSCVILPLSLLILPLYFGLNGVWVGMPVAKLFMFVLTLLLWRMGRKVEE